VDSKNSRHTLADCRARRHSHRSGRSLAFLPPVTQGRVRYCKFAPNVRDSTGLLFTAISHASSRRVFRERLARTVRTFSDTRDLATRPISRHNGKCISRRSKFLCHLLDMADLRDDVRSERKCLKLARRSPTAALPRAYALINGLHDALA